VTTALPPPPPPTTLVQSVHEPHVDDREPKTRRPLMFWDRIKILVILAVIFFFGVAIKKGDVPIMSWGEAIRDQLAARSWMLWLAGAEVLRQMHFLISERWAAYHQFWQNHVWGAWERQMSKLDPWLRYRLGRLFKVVCWIVILGFVAAAVWNLSFVEALAQAPARLWTNPFGDGGLPWFFQLFFAMFYVIIQFAALFWFMSRGGVDTYMPGEVKTRYADVWGQDNVLDKVQENVVFLEKPEEIEAKGGHVPGGILLWGPPGTGKTLMAEAVAGETGRPYVFVDPGAFINMFMGVGILKVKGLFRKLRKLSLKYGGVVVFFDEADSLGSRGGTGSATPGTIRERLESITCCNGLHFVSAATAEDYIRHQLDFGRESATASPADGIRGVMFGGMGMGGGGMGTLQALLTELSGLKKPRGMFYRRLRQFLSMKPKQPPKYRMLVMMATNMPQSLDPALLRPGRIDRIYKVGYPNLEGRVRTFEGYFDKVRHNLTEEQIERLAVISPRATGAIIKDIVNEALIVAMRNGRELVTWQDVIEARSMKIHGVPDGPAATALERHETAVHEASHAVAMYLLQKRSTIDIATIEQRGEVGGFVAPVPNEDRKFRWRAEMEFDIITFLVSLAGERQFFGDDNSVGVGGDLNASTWMVRRMLSRAAMGDTFTSHEVAVPLGEPDIGPQYRNDFDVRVERKLRELFDQAMALIEANQWFVMSVAHALQQFKTITGEDIDAIYHGTVGPTVDGRAYRSPSYQQAFSGFHAAARRAHDDQSPLTEEFPELDEARVAASTELPLPPPVPVAAKAT
jgi:ATP-dependent Zn protease